MNELAVIDQPQRAIAQREEPRTLSLTQVKAGLAAIRQVMHECMTEGQDFGKVPGCGDKPGLFQPGAQKLSMMFQLCPEVQKEEITDYPNFHRGYRLVVRVTNGSKFADGVGECSTMESKYRYRNGSLKCPECGKESVLKSKNPGDGYFCWAKKGGCGAKFALDDEGITGQSTGKVENENPADHWNTARKMAFKRGFVHAIINATNTSELWSQDLEDLAANGVVRDNPEDLAPQRRPEAPRATPRQQPRQEPPTSQPERQQEAPSDGLNREEVLFENYKVVNGTTKTGKNAGKPWHLFVCTFLTADSKGLECSTFSSSIGENLDTLKGLHVEITYRPNPRKAGTYELMSINPPNEIPMGYTDNNPGTDNMDAGERVPF